MQRMLDVTIKLYSAATCSSLLTSPITFINGFVMRQPCCYTVGMIDAMYESNEATVTISIARTAAKYSFSRMSLENFEQIAFTRLLSTKGNIINELISACVWLS